MRSLVTAPPPQKNIPDKGARGGGTRGREETFVDWPFRGENLRGMQTEPNIGGYGTPKFRGENFRGCL